MSLESGVGVPREAFAFLEPKILQFIYWKDRNKGSDRFKEELIDSEGKD